VGLGRVYLLLGNQFRPNEYFLFFPPGSYGVGSLLRLSLLTALTLEFESGENVLKCRDS